MSSQASNYIQEFQIRTTEGRTLLYDFSQLELLDKYIRDSGILTINKVSFYFNDPDMGFRNLILRQHEDYQFVPEFPYTFGTGGIRLPLLSEEEQRKDFNAVYDALNHSFNLDDRIGKYIINPFTATVTADDEIVITTA